MQIPNPHSAGHAREPSAADHALGFANTVGTYDPRGRADMHPSASGQRRDANQAIRATRSRHSLPEGDRGRCRSPAVGAHHAHERLSVSFVASRTLPTSPVSTLAVAVQVAPSSNFESTYSTSSSLESGANVALTSLPASSWRE